MCLEILTVQTRLILVRYHVIESFLSSFALYLRDTALKTKENSLIQLVILIYSVFHQWKSREVGFKPLDKAPTKVKVIVGQETH